MKYTFIIMALILVFLLIQKGEIIKPIKQQGTILAFGDSLTYGYNINPQQSYPSLLSNLSGLNVMNAGINGDTSADGVRRLLRILEDKNIQLMILFFGTNDIAQGISTKQLKANLKTMIQMAKMKGADALLVRVPNLNSYDLSPLALYEEVANEEHVPLLSDMYREILKQPSLKIDQVHPNALGYKLMAEKIYKSLKKNGWMDG